jgi:multidrug efflux pump subunit AcrA (membrane-fusion protein)
VVPQTALVYSLYGDSVYKVVNGVAIQTPVVTGLRKRDIVEIKEGLVSGDEVIISGQEKIQNKAAVKATVFQDSPPPTTKPVKLSS